MSSLSAIVKGHEFFLIFPRNWTYNAIGFAVCAAFVALAAIARLVLKRCV